MDTQRGERHHDRYWRISVWIDKALEEPVRAYARAHAVSVNALITRLITAELNEAGALGADDAALSAPAIVDAWMAAGVPIRSAKALARAGVTRQLAARLSDADLRALPAVGVETLEEVRRVVPAPPPAVERARAEAERSNGRPPPRPRAGTRHPGRPARPRAATATTTPTTGVVFDDGALARLPTSARETSAAS